MHLLDEVGITASVVTMVVGGQQRGQGHLGDQNKQQDYGRYFLKAVSATHPLFFHSCYHRFRVHWVYYGCLKDCFRFEGHFEEAADGEKFMMMHGNGWK